ALLAPEPARHMEGLPGALFFVLGDAKRKLSRVAERRHIDAVRPPAADIEQDQLEGAAQRAIGVSNIGEDVLLRPKAQLLPHWAIDHHQRRGKMRGRLDAVDID